MSMFTHSDVVWSYVDIICKQRSSISMVHFFCLYTDCKACDRHAVSSRPAEVLVAFEIMGLSAH